MIIKHDEIIKSLRGKVEVETNEEALAGVLVEVYDKPEGLLKDWKEREASKTQQRRIAACVTGSDGEFCFSDLPAGKYELRCSKPNGWNSTSVYVVLAPSDSRKNSPLTVPMQVSQ